MSFRAWEFGKGRERGLACACSQSRSAAGPGTCSRCCVLLQGISAEIPRTSQGRRSGMELVDSLSSGHQPLEGSLPERFALSQLTTPCPRSTSCRSLQYPYRRSHLSLGVYARRCRRVPVRWLAGRRRAICMWLKSRGLTNAGNATL